MGIAMLARPTWIRAGFYALRAGDTTVIRYDDRYSESVKTLEAAIPGAQLVPVEGLGRTFEVTVGNGWTGAQKVTVSAKPSSSSNQPRTAADDICG